MAHWLEYGKRLARVHSVSNWRIGDWIRFGTAKYGEKYGVASRVTGYDPQTLMNMASVATRFPLERRRSGVSWSHHAELASLPDSQQEEWLDLVERQHLTVRGLRHEIRSARRTPSGSDAPHEGPGTEDGRACPYCGCPMPTAHAAELAAVAGQGDRTSTDVGR
jgi:hypothetical protein